MPVELRTLKTCLRCGDAKPPSAFHKNRRKADGLDIYCKDCNTKRLRDKYATDEAWRQKKYAATLQYHRDNPEWSQERQRASHEIHKEARYQRAVARGADPAVRAQRRDSSRRSEQRRRAVKAAAAVIESITASALAARLLECGEQCWICKAEFSEAVALHWDHVQPLAHGGTHTIDNLKPACDLCNVRKNAMWPLNHKKLEAIAREVRALRKRLADAGTGV